VLCLTPELNPEKADLRDYSPSMFSDGHALLTRVPPRTSDSPTGVRAHRRD
jgi:hypothetical protein